MRYIEALLKALTKHIPPYEGAAHNITLDERGLMLTLMISSRRNLPVLLEEKEDYDKPVGQLVGEIEAYVKDTLR